MVQKLRAKFEKEEGEGKREPGKKFLMDVKTNPDSNKEEMMFSKETGKNGRNIGGFQGAKSSGREEPVNGRSMKTTCKKRERLFWFRLQTNVRTEVSF